MGEPHDRIRSLDGLRSLAIILVMFTHTIRHFWQEFQPYLSPEGRFSLYNIFYNGWCGVDLFFVLSGFLITQQLLDSHLEREKTRKKAILYYLKKRFFRIVPMYYLIVTLFLILSVQEGQETGLLPAVKEWGWAYLYHLLFLQDFFSVTKIAGFFWSVAIEIKFYMLAPLLVLFLARREKMPLRYGILAGFLIFLILFRCAVVLITPEAFPNYLEIPRTRFGLSLDGLMGGMICAYLWHDGKVRQFLNRRLVANTLFFTGLGVFVLLTGFRPLFDGPASFFDESFLVSFLSLGFSLMLLGVMGPSAGMRFFSLRIFRPVALVSYSLFLIHPLLYPIQSPIIESMASLTESFEARWVASLMFYFPASFCVAALFYSRFEKPIINWSKRK